MSQTDTPRARLISTAARDIRSELDSLGITARVSAGVEMSAQQAVVRLSGLRPQMVGPLVSIFHGCGLVAFSGVNKEDVLAIGTHQQFAFALGQLSIMADEWPTVAAAIQGVLQPPVSHGWELAHDRSLPLGKRTLVMGILNLSPDSFSGDGIADPDRAVGRAEAMVEEGADIVDVGGESTRPGAEPISVEEEMRRVIPVIERLAKIPRLVLSIDTYKPQVAEVCLKAGAHIVNDVFALRHPGMAEIVAEYRAGVVLMHMLGEPRTMQSNPSYANLMHEIYIFLAERVDFAIRCGIGRERIAIDPGIGFGKTIDHNLEILRRLRELTSMGLPVLIGPSRKSFIGKVLDVPVDQRLEGTAAVIALAIANGASIIRVHDVRSMVKVARMAEAIVGGRRE